jgi:hypothetical protein
MQPILRQLAFSQSELSMILKSGGHQQRETADIFYHHVGRQTG